MAISQAAQDQQQGRAARSLMSTMPGEPPPPESWRSVSPLAESLSDAPPASDPWLSSRPSWCVDLGHTLVAMSTCELWLAFAKGSLTPETKVWREGMPWWEPLSGVPEFALAMPEASAWEAPARTLVGAEKGPRAASEVKAAAAEIVVEARAPEAWSAEAKAAQMDVMTPPPGSGDFGTPAPVVVDSEPAPRKSGSRRRFLPKLDRRTALSAAFGAAAAALLLAVATSGQGSGEGRSAEPLRPAAGVMGAAGVDALQAVGVAPVPAEKATAAAASSSSAPEARERAPRRPRPWERGQQRAR